MSQDAKFIVVLTIVCIIISYLIFFYKVLYLICNGMLLIFKVTIFICCIGIEFWYSSNVYRNKLFLMTFSNVELCSVLEENSSCEFRKS